MFHELTVSEVRTEGRGAVAVSFDVPEALQGVLAWQPGQYLTLRAQVSGADLRRSYSIASQPGTPLQVGIKQVAGGAFSTFAQGLRPGDRVQVMPPQGRFVWAGQDRVVLIAAGSGITPMVSIAAAALARGAEVCLLYGNRSVADIMFRGTLDALKDRYTARFTLIHVLTREPRDVALLNGRITGEKVQALDRAGVLDLAHAEAVFLCGPGGMIDDVAGAIGALVPPERTHTERFFTEDAPRPARSHAAESAAQRGVAVEVRLDGATHGFGVDASDESVLAAAERQGLELPYSCRGGMCCTCRCRIVQGAAEMAVNYSLEPWEIAAGFTLACQARPVSDRLVLDFDAV